ncbi:MAG: hypothetical protein EYC69_11840 [Bacteroidetes bacterium]|nr:MAG: hypothetical protein EYC69_11840 [Bacteroidota bacterium]
MMKYHKIWMLISCALPLLLIFLTPSIGLGDSWGLFFFIIAMFGIHLLIPHHDHNQKADLNSNQNKNHSHH